MRTIAELNMLFHTSVELPAGLKLATEAFQEGWSFVRRVDARRLKKRIQTRGWNFIPFADGSLRSGVGETSQAAIASALKLALRRVRNDSNAVEVEHIELTRYPWFFLARVRVYPYRIQEGSTIPKTAQASLESNPAHCPRLPEGSAALIPHFGSAMPMLKEMLVSSRISEATAN